MIADLRPRHPGSCAQCGSLDTAIRFKTFVCRDCGAASRNGEVVKTGIVDIHYSLQVLTQDGRTLWCETLDILFEAQCDVAAGLRISPGSSFSRWLKSREGAEGLIEDADTLRSMRRIVGKLVSYSAHIRDPYNLDAIQKLQDALPMASRFRLTLDRR